MSLEKCNFLNLWNEILSKFHNSEEKILPLSIPILPFEITPAILGQLLIASQQLWMNMPASAVEVITNEQGTISEVYLHKADQEGMYKELLKMDLVAFPVKALKLAEMDSLFEKIKKWVKKQYSVDIGNVRQYPISLFQQLGVMYNTHNNTQKHLQNVLVLIGGYLDSILDALEKETCFIYPNSLIFDYMLALQKFFGKVSFRKFGEFLTKTLPDMNITISLYGDDWFFAYHVFHEKYQLQLNHIPNPELMPIEEEPISRQEGFLKQIALKSKSKQNFLFQANAFVDLLYDIFQTPIPADGPRFRFLFQKALYRYRGVGTYWNVHPRPLIYFGGVRFLVYMLGYHLNLQKLSHWAIPDIMASLFNKVFGLSGQMILICGDSLKALKNSQSIDDIYVMLFKYDNGMFTKAASLKSADIYASNDINYSFNLGESEEQQELEKIRLSLTEKYGYIHSVIWISINLIRSLLKSMGLDLHSQGIGLKNLTQSIALIQDSSDFTMSPSNPVYLFLKKQKPATILKKIAPIITDLNEF
jgi:hypothetical protein